MGATYSDLVERGNPVLAHFGGFIVQPYWLIIVQLIVIQTLQRIYNKFTPFVKNENKKTILIALELVCLGEEGSDGVKPSEYSVLDFVLSLISVAQFIYASVKQEECMSAKNSNTWRCYNAYGYRLHNYVLPSVISVLVQAVVQVFTVVNRNKKDEKFREKAWFMLRMFLLGSTIAMNLALCLVFVPYFITNTMPMFVGFFWLLIPLLLVLTLVYAGFITVVIIIVQKYMNIEKTYFRKIFLAHCAVGLQVFGCLVVTMAYNYSQYCYFGGGYLSAIRLEFYSHDTAAWGDSFKISTQNQVDTFLSFF